jgi:probable HAF family extracellular repeat protein
LITDTHFQVHDVFHERADQRGIRDPFENRAEPHRVGVNGISGARARLDPGLQIVQVRVEAGDPITEIQKTPSRGYAYSLSVSMKHMHKAELDGRATLSAENELAMKTRPRVTTIFLVIGIALFAAYAWTQESQQERPVWDVQLARNAQASSSITIRNQCQQTHTFTVTPQQTPFLQLLAAPTVNVAGNSSYELPVRFDTTGMNAGQYQGTVLVKCDTCRREGTCKQDREILPVRLTVLPDGTQPRPTATPTPTPTPRPIGAGATPSPGPSSSPSPCAPASTSTTYVVKDLGALPSLSSFPSHCIATGVNDDGHVVGACLGVYAGGPPSGSYHAFRTHAGGEAIKPEDDLGFPAGLPGGGSYATGVNAKSHVVGWWQAMPFSGVKKAFWYDGSKMLNLHPATSSPSFTTSEAYAVNIFDDVVGTASPDVPDKHAVIWSHGDHVMTDLNSLVPAATKKDWKLIEAYAINDAGEIVGRAKHLDKLHAFLLKTKSAVLIDLGALKEYKDDSSAAYSINACDQVVGYTYTSKASHHGFIWKEESGMKDMTTLSPPYIVSYAQAINEKGEVVGTASKGFHHSAFFEGIGFAVGTDSHCAAYSHAVWYNGSDLKDLNTLISAHSGWELSLANGINGKGQIAGSGFHLGSAKCSGSLHNKAVLLTPAALTPSRTEPPKGYLFDNWNTSGVRNGPTPATTFTTDDAYVITFIADYHWNGGKGAVPGKTGISLKDSHGKVFGPWPVTASAGQGGAANVNWECHPGITLPAGTYTVVDPDPATWSHNDASGNKGFTRVAGSGKKG